MTATATRLLVLTTPFVQPSGCDSRWSFTRVSTFSILVSDLVPSCHPSGWDEVVPQIQLKFRPAVCPSGWTYYRMGDPDYMVEAANPSSISSTTAKCCNSGFTLDNIHGPLIGIFPDSRCIRILSGTETTFPMVTTSDLSANSIPSLASTALPFGQTFMVHEAWAVTWAASDRPTLTPKLPDLTSWMLIPTWNPGESIPKGLYDRHGSENSQSLTMPRGFFWFLVIGGPIIFLVSLSLCISCCVINRKQKRRKEAARMEAANIQREATE
ncbi:hypothetical protein VTL71DRAFT_3659 [Oculimacula yallundae]|uniref:T cell CD4 receptor C-terminal region domain-containing protein n=1 Tax=Oculimacula yallundae TaxID=86028 RepID=A0ABR4C3K2_9HELO